MKHFIKVFSIAFLCFALAAGAFIVTMVMTTNSQADTNGNDFTGDRPDNEDGTQNEDGDKEDEIKDPLMKAIAESDRLNVVLLGMEGPRTDTIIFTSFDPKTKNIDMISIPRDTYFHREGFDEADKKKINAVYGHAGSNGTMKAIENVLGGVPVHHYIRISYTGVEKIVDSLNGVEVDVPFHFFYKDPTDDPPLVIDVPEGRQVLYGDKAIEFLRFRKGLEGYPGYSDGDIGRMKAQQQFLKSAAKKALGFRLPSVINTVFKYVKTDFELSDVMLYANDAIGIKLDSINMKMLPGIPKYIGGTSYFVHDPNQVKEVMMDLYNVEPQDEEITED